MMSGAGEELHVISQGHHLLPKQERKYDDEGSSGLEDPLLLQPPSHERAITNTNIAEVYNLILDGHELEESRPSTVSSSSLEIKGSFFGSVANLCSATLGAGVLSLPFAFYQAGIIVGVILLLLSALATAISVHLIVKACEFYQLYTYEALVESLFGRRLRTAVEVCIVLFCGGCATSYVIAVGDILQKSALLLDHSRTLSMVLVWAIAMLPLSLLKRMQNLQFASAVGIASIGTLVFSALIHLIDDEKTEGHDSSSNTTVSVISFVQRQEGSASLSHFLWPANGAVSILTACPIVLFAFSCQVNVCAIYEELPELDKQALMRRVTLVAVAICTALYCSISLIALADFGSSVSPNILSSYAPKGIMQVACASMAAAVIMAFPLNIFPARVTLMGIFFPEQAEEPLIANPTLTAALLEDQQQQIDAEDQKEESTENGGAQNGGALEAIASAPDRVETSAGESEPKDFHLWRHAFLTLLLTGTALGMAIIIPNISVVFGLIGGTATSLLGFCVPGLLGIRLCRDTDRGGTMLLSSWILLVGGAVVGLLTTAVTVYSTFTP